MVCNGGCSRTNDIFKQCQARKAEREKTGHIQDFSKGN